MEGATSCPSGAGGVAKKQVTHALIKDIVTKALQDMGYECPDTDLDRFVRSATPSTSRASSSATSPASSQTSSENTTRSSSPTRRNKNKRRARSSSSEGSSTDNTVVGSGSATDDESDSGKSGKSGKSATGKADASQSESFTLVKGKNKKAIRKAIKKSKTSDVSPPNGMDIDASRAASAANNVVTTPPQTHNLPATPTQAASKSPSVAGAKPTAPPRSKIPSPIFLRKGANFLKISSDCTRLRINYSKATRVADDGIKILCPNVETFRSLTKYLVDNKVQFHTYALEEESKLKVVIRGIPTNFPTEDIQTDLREQGFPVQSVHRICRRDGSPLWLVLAVLPKTEEARKISLNLRQVCGLSGIRVEAPHKRGGPGQCHRCQLYGHAAANCHAEPRCVKCLVPHWTKECPLTRESGDKPSCVNCGQHHTANYRGCKFPTGRSALHKPWTKARTTQPPSAASRPHREAQRSPPVPPPVSATAGSSSFGNDIQTVMAVLRAVSSSEIAEFAGQLRACRNVEEKLLVSVRYHDLMNVTLLSFNANGLSKNIPELTMCMSEYGVDIALIQETFLKPTRPRACAIAGYAQLRTDRTHARRGYSPLL
ncbi:Nucleic-acid-binding protein from transposon X-element [Eumeta japonica]|uniref:Nucleic-acid-binding protein from transposon X-element n=1 Tax=Eumeta variegata TaxID=151549 RepID=A0A4C1WYD2_EUMVA|nr:Nucleic-acid-binding protein from transposon X-element [Eumeta japonica]